MKIQTEKLQDYLTAFFARGSIGHISGQQNDFPACCARIEAGRVWVIGADAESDHDARAVAFDTAEVSHADPARAEWVSFKVKGKFTMTFCLLEGMDHPRRAIWQEQIREAFMREGFLEWAQRVLERLSS